MEARYNGTDGWRTVCVDFFNEFRYKMLANDACQDLGYPWARVAREVKWHSAPPGYTATGPDLVLRELVLESAIGDMRWTLGEDSCRRHQYDLVFVECETGGLSSAWIDSPSLLQRSHLFLTYSTLSPCLDLFSPALNASPFLTSSICLCLVWSGLILLPCSI